MGDEFYAIIKLVSGEEVLSLISIDDNDGDPLVVMQNPITMKLIYSQHGMHVKVKSWMELASDDFFIVRPDKILTMTETHDERMIEIYNNYLEDEDDMDVFKPQSSSNEKLRGDVKPSRKMGYLSTVEEARKSLENIFKLEDTKES
tara:strand:+ start:1862 stop:2299 length:438 start_codon:yes stop_codon:yes gene_type:complete